MKAEIEGLSGSYYGTHVRIVDGPLRGQGIAIWFSTGEPSERQKREWGHDPLGKSEVYDSHYECTYTFKMAERIVEMLANIKDEEIKDDI